MRPRLPGGGPRLAALQARPRMRDRTVLAVAGGAVLLLLVVAFALPLGGLFAKSLQDPAGRFVGFANFARVAATPALLNSARNSLALACLVALIVVPLAFAYAYAVTRTAMRLRAVFAALAFLPLFTPSLLPAISFIYLFGNQGLLKPLLLGTPVYGPTGIVLAEIFHVFPHAFVILATVLRLADQRLYEAAEAMGTSAWRTFRVVTLPVARYGLASAVFVTLTLVITDFGIPKVIGGSFPVLATQVYKQAVGQQNLGLGSVVAIVLLVPAVLAFAADRLVRRGQAGVLSSSAIPFVPRRRAGVDRCAFVACASVAAFLVGVVCVSIWASLVTYWPYDLSVSLRHYALADVDVAGWAPLWNSVRLAAMASLAGTVLIFAGAYVVEKAQGPAGLGGCIQFLAMLPLAVPGLVLGLAYAVFINSGPAVLSPLAGTITLMALSCVAHFYTVPHVTALAALKQLDPEFERVAQSLSTPVLGLLARVTIPLCLPAILDMALYLFVNALTTVSAVVFLYGPGTKLATIAIVQLDEAGETAAAAALATVLFAVALGAKLVQVGLARWLWGPAQRWRAPHLAQTQEPEALRPRPELPARL